MNEQQGTLVSVETSFGYLQQEALDVIAGVILVMTWVAALVFYDPHDSLSLRIWALTATMVSLACTLALWLNRHHFRSAALVLIGLLFVADATVLHTLRDGQVAYFAVPLISLAVYLVGPVVAVTVAAAVILLVGLSWLDGVPLLQLAGPLLLVFLTTMLSWLSSRHLYTALHWAWASHLRSLKKAEEAQLQRGQLARMSKSLNEAYDRLSRLNEAFLEAWREAEEARRFKAQLAANVSHELRTPLTIIVGFSETMLFAPESYGPELPAPYRNDLMEIYNSSRHLLSLVDDILDLAQIEAGRMGLVKETTDMSEIIREAVAMMRVLAERKGLSLETRIQERLPLLRVDRSRIRQVLLNLLSNAVRYTNEGAVTVEAWVDGNQLVVAVTDTGPGIPAEHLERVFESFFQVDSSLSRRHGGAGLGLAISKYFVEMHGGWIKAESQLGVGSRFTFSLPLPTDSLHPVFTHGNLPQRVPPPPVPREARQVLLVHPDVMAAQLLERHLDDYEVLYASNAAEAQERLMTIRPRAIITSQDSLVSALSARKDEQPIAALSHVPLITCPLPLGLRSALAAGVRGYLVKPVSRQKLLSTLEGCEPQARRILVVDDDPRVVRLLTRMLLSAKGRYHILRAFDGHQALAIMRTDKPDLVLLDLYMPEPDGFTILDHMKSDPVLASIPVIVVSAKGLPEDGVLRLEGQITVSQLGGFSLAELFRYLQVLLDTAGFPHAGEPTSDPVSAGGHSG